MGMRGDHVEGVLGMVARAGYGCLWEDFRGWAGSLNGDAFTCLDGVFYVLTAFGGNGSFLSQ
jgi:hypothetical protein